MFKYNSPEKKRKHLIKGLCRDYMHICSSHEDDVVRREKLRESARESFKKFANVPNLKTIAVVRKDFRFIAHTECIYIKDQDGRRREIGEFLIEILMRGEHGPEFHCWNITRTIPAKESPLGEGSKGYNHPHIGPHGYLCMQNGQNDIHCALADGDLLRAVSYIIHALQSYTHGAAYPSASIEQWPFADAIVAPHAVAKGGDHVD